MNSMEVGVPEVGGGQAKVRKYADRIEAGESMESIMQDLKGGGVFRDGIEKELYRREQERKEKVEEQALSPEDAVNHRNSWEKMPIIPKQYEGLDSETLDFIWTVPEYLDPEKTKQETERKARALLHVRTQEKNIEHKRDRIIRDQEMINDLRNQLGISDGDREKNSFQGEIEKLVDNRVNIDFDTVVFNERTHATEKVSGQSNIIDFAGRKIVVLDIEGKNIPFYLSTGHGGKADVTSGKWYPIFGIDPRDGWLNKLSGKEINTYYGSDILRQISETLDRKIGDVRDKEDIQKVGLTGAHIGVINKDIVPVENEKKDTKEKIEKNIKEIVAYLDAQFKEGKVGAVPHESPLVSEEITTESISEAENNTKEVSDNANISFFAPKAEFSLENMEYDTRQALVQIDVILEKARRYDEARKKITEEITRQFNTNLETGLQRTVPLSNAMHTAMNEKIRKEIGYYAEYELGFTADELNQETRNIVDGLQKKYDISQFVGENQRVSYRNAAQLKAFLNTEPLVPKKPPKQEPMKYPDTVPI